MAQSRFAVEVFCSYAHEDEGYRRQLETYLSPLKRQGLISLWHDREILPGSNWVHTIDEHLETASIIVLLISADFIASDYCYDIEMKRALERHESNEARVIPIIVRPCEWQQLSLASLQTLPTDGKPISKWTTRDEAWTQIAAGLRRVVEDLSLLPASAPRSALPNIWMIPYPRNPFFLERDELLSQIHTLLQAGQATALSQALAISGLGGIGKTQIAVEYAYRYSQEYQMVLWAQAESAGGLNTSYSQITVKLNLPEKEAQEQEIIIRAVKTWLQDHRNWLLILDNADELALLKDFLPPVGGGHVLITTRASATGQLARRIEIGTFSEEQGALFLLRQVSRLTPDDLLSQASEYDQVVARAISNELGGLPLALDQAGAYLEQTGYSLSDYQQIYRSRREYLLAARGALAIDHSDPIVTTWLLSFARVEQKSPMAMQILRLCAYLSADAIPLELMTDGTDPIVSDLWVLGQAIETLRAYSLVSHDPATRTLSIHRLVQAVIRNAMTAPEQVQWCERVIRTLDAIFPEDAIPTTWIQCEQLLPHVVIMAGILSEETKSWKLADILRRAARYLFTRAQYAEAEPLFKRALAIDEQVWGPENFVINFSLNDLADFYESQGKYEQAELLYQRTLSIITRVYGRDRPEEITHALGNLALLYKIQEKYEQAEPLYQRALAIHEQQLGANHPDTATGLNNLAGLYFDQGRYMEAESLFKRALSIREQQLGADHLATTRSLGALATLYEAQEKYAEAELLLKRVLSICAQQWGGDHPYTARSLNNLALLYHKQGKHGEAEPLYQHALQIWEQRVESEHLERQITQSNYDSLLTIMGKNE